MTRSLQTTARRLAACVALSAAFTAVIVTPGSADPTHRIVGYGGVLPLPVAHGTSAAAPTSIRGDRALAQRRDARGEHGRVLYASGRAPGAATDTTSPRHTPCPAQRVAELRLRASMAPNS